jgi:hypothetical protein
MKRAVVGFLAIVILVISGCGDASVSVVIPITLLAPPSITAYQFSKDQAAQFVDGSVDFIAPDSDIDTITIAVIDSNGFLVTRTRTTLRLPGVTSGRIPFSIDYSTYVNGTYTFSVFVTDFNGNTSNQIVDRFSVP